MAGRPKVAPLLEHEAPDYLAPRWSSVGAHLLWKGDRRIDAKSYLSSGFGIRLALEDRVTERLRDLAKIWAPPRIKSVIVSPEFGAPYLNTSQVFDIRPTPRKWLSMEKTAKAEARLVEEGTILVMASANVGRSTIATCAHAGAIVSHHFMRVEPLDASLRGWIYGFLRSSQGRSMMSGSQYASIIRHIEPTHLGALPIPKVGSSIAKRFQNKVDNIISLRNRAYRLSLEAEEHFERVLGPLKVDNWGQEGFLVSASDLWRGRRRFEAMAVNPGVSEIRRHLGSKGKGLVTLARAGYSVWLPSRFRRIPAEDGLELVDSSAVFELNPETGRLIADGNFGDPYNGRVKAGWLLMARSGQTYGINGTVALAMPEHEGKIVSDDLLRIASITRTSSFRAGYLFVALSHPTLGRPLVKAMAYGSSIPHIDAADLLEFEVVRLSTRHEDRIADLVEESVSERARADQLERELAKDAELVIGRLLAGML